MPELDDMGRHSAQQHPTGRHPYDLGRSRPVRARRLRARRAWVGRITLVIALVASLSASALTDDATRARWSRSDTGPTTIEALASGSYDLSPPSSLVSPMGQDIETHDRHVSRSQSRLEFQTEDGAVFCDGIVTDLGTNGRVPDAELCDLWQKPYRDRADAAVSLFALNDRYVVRFGEPICLTSAYRTYEEQAALRRKKGGIAAPAGLSNHGWGLAVDFCSQTYAGERGDWLWDKAGIFGWENPEWARQGGSGYYEPWHWEYVPGVQAIAASGLG